MKNIDIKNFISIILSYSWIGSIRLDELIENIIESTEVSNSQDKEYYFENLADIHSPCYSKMVTELLHSIDYNKDCPLIELAEEVDGYYIKRLCNDNQELYTKVIRKIESFDKLSNKGIRFEKFCIDFLNDIGINAKSTKVSGDKGIDIIGHYKTKLDITLGSVIKYDYVYILAQAKYFNKKIDTPVIRKLVGDSIFIRFDDLVYVDIKHNALHLIVFSRKGFTNPALDFAKRNKIEVLDSDRIAHIITNNPQKTWHCIE
jgi:HJR/Mrr/RecB family endonuclease